MPSSLETQLVGGWWNALLICTPALGPLPAPLPGWVLQAETRRGQQECGPVCSNRGTPTPVPPPAVVRPVLLVISSWTRPAAHQSRHMVLCGCGGIERRILCREDERMAAPQGSLHTLALTRRLARLPLRCVRPSVPPAETEVPRSWLLLSLCVKMVPRRVLETSLKATDHHYRPSVSYPVSPLRITVSGRSTTSCQGPAGQCRGGLWEEPPRQWAASACP